jgi:hypothetical protein
VTGNNSGTTPTLNGIDQTESHIIISLDGSSVVIHSSVPSREGGGRRGTRRSRSGGRLSLGGLGSLSGLGSLGGLGRGLGLGALEAIIGQLIEEATDELYIPGRFIQISIQEYILYRCTGACERNDTHLVLQIDQIESNLLDVRRVVSIVPTRHVSLLPRRNRSTVVVRRGVGRRKSTSDSRRGIGGSSWRTDQEDGDGGDDGGESEETHLVCGLSESFCSFKRREGVVKLQDLKKRRVRLGSFIPRTRPGNVLRACFTLNEVIFYRKIEIEISDIY